MTIIAAQEFLFVKGQKLWPEYKRLKAAADAEAQRLISQLQTRSTPSAPSANKSAQRQIRNVQRDLAAHDTPAPLAKILQAILNTLVCAPNRTWKRTERCKAW